MEGGGCGRGEEGEDLSDFKEGAGPCGGWELENSSTRERMFGVGGLTSVGEE